MDTNKLLDCEVRTMAYLPNNSEVERILSNNNDLHSAIGLVLIKITTKENE